MKTFVALSSHNFADGLTISIRNISLGAVCNEHIEVPPVTVFLQHVVECRHSFGILVVWVGTSTQ